MMTRRRIVFLPLLVLSVLAIAAGVAAAQEQSLKPGINDRYGKEDVQKIVDQFENQQRDVVQKRDEILAACELRPGMVVADLGAGTGLFSRLFAPKVAPGGKVYAADITEQFVAHIKKTCKEQGIDNVETIVSTPTSTMLPAESTDLIFTCDVYHHFEFPFKMLASIHQALRPGGRLIVIDRREASDHTRADQETVKNEVRDAGFQWTGDQEISGEHYLMCFRKPLTLQIWPGDAPGEKGDIGEEGLQPLKPEEKRPILRLANVSRPTITLYKPPKETDTGAAVMICPGGGYSILALNLEGQEVAAWLNSIGVTGIVLEYRVPRRKGLLKHEAPLQDAQRAMSLVRSNAQAWSIDPAKIGILGFSAGGHLSATAATNFDRRAYPSIDEVDKISCRPDFAVLVYPAYLIEGEGLAPEIRVGPETPPVFFAHASDNGISAENSIAMYVALKRAKVPAELHIYAKGGHGFGLRPSPNPCCTWPERCGEWMKSQGIIEKR